MWFDGDQVAVAEAQEGVFAIFAGAGSGKTATLTARVQQLIHDGAAPSSIVVSTFTRKAAQEIRDRIGNPEVVCDTMHSICLQWIRSAGETAGFKYGIHSVLTEPEVKRLVKDGGDLKKAMAEARAIGFDQIVEVANQILAIDPAILIGDVEHFIVDEAQDCSADQWETIERIVKSGLCQSVMVTGDFRQSIYQWRNASPDHGVAFSQRDGVKRLWLNNNYRSDKKIVDLANKVAAIGGFEEPMREQSDANGRVEFIKAPSVEGYIAKEVDDLANEFVPYSDIAVLCRYNREADVIAAYMEGTGIPIDRAKPINREALDKFCSWANWMGNRFSSPSMRVFLDGLLPPETITALDAEAKRYMSDPVRAIFSKSSGDPAYKRVAEALTANEQLDERSAAAAWAECGGTREEFRDFIAPAIGLPMREVSEAVNINCKAPIINRIGVAITTAHGAKGLEWPHVFVVGATQRQMPGGKRGWRRAEELRLLYVAITRAEKDLRLVIPEAEQWSEFISDEHGKPLSV